MSMAMGTMRLWGGQSRSGAAVLASVGLHLGVMACALMLTPAHPDVSPQPAAAPMQVTLIAPGELARSERMAIEYKAATRQVVMRQAAVPAQAAARSGQASKLPAPSIDGGTEAHIAGSVREPSASVHTATASIQRMQPDYAYNPAPDYPQWLREQGVGGVVWLRVWVEADGRPGEIALLKGSGYRLLDESALRAVRYWRFLPARQGDQALAGWVEFPIRFVVQG